MNAITNAVRGVTLSIPRPLLEYGLRGIQELTRFKSIEDIIVNDVIRNHVMIDMNLYGSDVINIPIASCNVVYTGNEGVTISVPKHLTNGRAIVLATTIISGDAYGTIGFTGVLGGGSCTTRNIDVNTIANNIRGVTSTYGTSNIRLVGENLLYIKSNNIDMVDGIIEVMIENDVMLNNISPRSYPVFTELCVLAVKNYIYMESIVNLNQGFIEHGHSLDFFKGEIEKWETAREEYLLYFEEKWKVVSYINDKHRKNKLIKGMFGNNY